MSFIFPSKLCVACMPALLIECAMLQCPNDINLSYSENVKLLALDNQSFIAVVVPLDTFDRETAAKT